MQQLLTESATTLARRIRAGEVTASEVVEAHIRHVQQLNPTLNAVVFERFGLARAEAAEADKKIAACKTQKQRNALPAMLGVPCTIKENFEFEGTPQASGLVARRHIINDKDAPTVARIRAAGAIPLGVTNTSELCMWMESNNRVYGRTNNPYNPAHIVGGSSGGEGAIIGSGGSPFGLGADVGGSIRMPAFFNGVFGHKPTPGIVPNTGQVPMPHGDILKYCVTGPLARRAEDLMPLMRILAGPDAGDPLAGTVALGDPATVDLSKLHVISIHGNGRQAVTADLRQAQRQCESGLQGKVASIHITQLEALKKSFEIWSAMMGAANDEAFAAQLGEGKAIPVGKELGKWLIRRSPHTLPALGLAALERLPLPAKFIAMGETLRAQFLELLDNHGVMLFPSYTRPAPRHYLPVARTFDWVYTGIINVMQLPATQVPLGLNAKGLPLGVQVVGAPGRDHETIAVAMELEQQFGGWVPPWQTAA
ncbi:MAG: amidase [Nevskiales bacterium]